MIKDTVTLQAGHVIASEGNVFTSCRIYNRECGVAVHVMLFNDGKLSSITIERDGEEPNQLKLSTL